MAETVDPGVKAYRAQVLVSLEAHMKAIGNIVEGEVPFWHHIPDHAVALVGSSRGLLEIFPDKAGGATKGANGKEGAGDEKPTPFAMAAVKFNEQSARMVAMNNATDNAGELVEILTLDRNKARQTSITNEILDIVGGAEALG